MLELIEVRKQYHPKAPPALDGVTFRVATGEFVAVLGRSGAGKTTLVRCINGLVRPDGGRILLDGEEIQALPPAALRELRRQIGMVFQQFNLIERLDAVTNVLVGRFAAIPVWRALLGRFPAAEVERALAALDRVGIRGLAYERVSQLSGGQRQRVGIARALVQSPRLILADEPVSSLDPITARQIMDLLADINRERGMTMVVNLHDVTLASEYAQRIVGLSEGRVVFDGPAHALDRAVLRQIYGEDGAPAPPPSPPRAPVGVARLRLRDDLALGD